MPRKKAQLCNGGKGWYEGDDMPTTKTQLFKGGEGCCEVDDIPRKKYNFVTRANVI